MVPPDSPRRRVPRWATTVLVVVVAVVLLLPGPWRQAEKLGTTVLAPIQMGVALTSEEVGSVLGALPRVRELSEQNRDYREEISRLE